MKKSSTRRLAWTLFILSVFGAVAEICTSWNVLSIFLGRQAAVFLSLAVFHFTISDNLCVYRTAFNETARFWGLMSNSTLTIKPLWLILYGVSIYACFHLFFTFSYMHIHYQTSLFLYVYFVKFHMFVPYVVNWLIIPAVTTTTLNAFNKVSSLLSDLCQRWSTQVVVNYKGGVYETVQQTLKWTLCILLSISFTESVYLSLQYGVAHYQIMHQISASTGLLNEVLLISAIALSTLHTMSRVAGTIVTSVLSPITQIHSMWRQLNVPYSTISVRVWGYFTVLIRALVRGLQTASIGQGAKLVVVNYTDKADRNAVAFWYENNHISTDYGSEGQEKVNEKQHAFFDSVKQILGFKV